MQKLGRKLNSQQLKAKILIKQYGRCAYCNSSLHDQEIEWDHFIPWSYLNSSGGDDNWVAACKLCNGKKSSKVFTSIEQITQFSYKMVKSHGSFAEGWSEDSGAWKTELESMIRQEIPVKIAQRLLREANSWAS